jgi:N-acetylated-alpha-linked acidic dipeptidase
LSKQIQSAFVRLFPVFFFGSSVYNRGSLRRNMAAKSLIFRGAAFGLVTTFLLLGCPGPGRENKAGPGDQAIASFKSYIDAVVSPAALERYLKYFTSSPHVASTPRNLELARFVMEEWKSFGLEDVHLAEYDVLLSFPREISVEMVSPKSYTLKLREASYPEDPDTRKDVGIPYNAYSRSGDLLAPLVYANSGNPQDYDVLEKNGINLKGKIALVRYSEPYSYRGFKALTAERRGLAGLLIYSDPKEDGWARGPVFPQGPWGPPSHIQRGGIPYDFIYPGDPLTPGWPSTPGCQRLNPDEARTLPRIMSVPISAEDALPLLEALDGEEVPPEWRGALPVTYRIGGTSPRVRLHLVMDNSIRRITNVIGCIRGAENPDQIVLVGNHRDAWVYGGYDPSSGTACLMELARAFGRAKKAGFVPLRSIYFASWDAEEFTLTGSTEWGEENRDLLRKNLVAYLNVDSSASGKDFSVSAVPSLSRVITRSLQEVQDPGTGKPIYEGWKSGPETKEKTATAGTGGEIEPIGSGSDHTVFLNHICAPALDMTFNGDYGVYHSMYDDYYWMSHFGDPGMAYTAALARIWAHQAVDLSSSLFLPLDFESYAEAARKYLSDWADRFDVSREKVGALMSLAGEWQEIAASVNAYLFKAPGLVTEDGLSRAGEVNALLLGMERRFLLSGGIPGREWFKHLIFGTRSTYAVLLLPELTEAAEAGNEPGVSEAILHLEQALRRINGDLGEIDSRLRAFPGLEKK